MHFDLVLKVGLEPGYMYAHGTLEEFLILGVHSSGLCTQPIPRTLEYSLA